MLRPARFFAFVKKNVVQIHQYVKNRSETLILLFTFNALTLMLTL